MTADHRFVRPGQVAPDRPAPDACMTCGLPEPDHPAPAGGPFATERQAREAAQLYAALSADPAAYISADANRQLLLDSCNAAGVQLGDYDRRILDWLAGYEPATCAVIAGLITRAAEPTSPGPAD
jgi:hypothetical protein